MLYFDSTCDATRLDENGQVIEDDELPIQRKKRLNEENEKAEEILDDSENFIRKCGKGSVVTPGTDKRKNYMPRPKCNPEKDAEKAERLELLRKI